MPAKMAAFLIESNRRSMLLQCWTWTRSMTTSKRVQDRSKLKRVHDLEVVTEKHKIASKMLFLMEVLKKEPEMVAPVRSLDQYRRQINLPKPHSLVDFIRKSPRLFELYKDQKGLLWCGMTNEAEELVEEEDKLIEDNMDRAAEYVTRMLMMSVDKRLSLDKIAHFRRDFGLPADFRTGWAQKYLEHFQVVKSPDGPEYLELVGWNPSWAITELEKKAVVGGTETKSTTPSMPGLLSLPFPLKFPPNFKKVYRIGGKLEHFQKLPYLSPYADARGLEPGSKEFDKRAIAVMHEILSFTLEKRLVTDHLTHFRREFVMPQKLMRLLLKHMGIFYVSERGKRFCVYLTEAYEGRELIQKPPLVLWKEKVLSLTGYRGKKKQIETFSDFSDTEDEDVIESNPEDGNVISS
ncbi:protein WHAT'S THIS FACTOR 1 homolog, chloroplastic [Punica granatum]|uniref:Protein WHAT'S THIS FACTOR 1 homolog, chloroplastic n=1 Tax=Punica granatum TaxID=22663 RepID=A0A6P8DW42_PUNGR|nr:protein WHAT'S THIS FACTOR 1 homolog, chloroplastic [Punica granatum]XP_031401667.1 protein WHAT'S THIS FACTOR 1 homolog, chloroplastic [Punica granatum]XP_031401668.1 protein WHAT'S THIS FACTOR 1 homolog, chloroplastic [Punica granatum]XP_031401669.1 protein WHAT'S THIS FACTOR 1 homolog, chloroplastic [Punica granatum]XP_031401670.1 protein WHAT'S THIS FACTOR 1 homolog, chloroplastic [Punica granatum]XP_031401671.1 protein WHAT'S THIS FACTOR 1 homolog, chloroplastic [Punica granatum]XP_03